LCVEAFENLMMLASGKRCKVGWLALLVMAGSSWGMAANAEPRVNSTAADLRIAAERFDQGRDAFKVGAYAEAAEHFEAADARAPSASALGLAMRSRAETRQTARAATLAELVLRRHPDDSELVDRAKAIIEAAAPEAGRVAVACEPACDLVVDHKLIHGRATEQWIVYLEPGEHVVAANWSGDRVVTEPLTAVAGESSSLRFQPVVPKPAKPVATAPRKPAVPEDSTTAVTAPSDQFKRLSPVFFWVGVGTTVALGGATIWSGVDTLNNPGPDAVRERCAGLGESCELYREGQRKELRTNVLFGISAAVAVATAVTGLFFTDFSPARAERDVRTGRILVRPWALAMPEVSGRGGLLTAIGAEGRF
jgi:hypothetical protein